MPSFNEINNIRPESHFELFQPFTDQQLEAWETLFELANQIIDHKVDILKKPQPFKNARWIAITGGPGTGKSHLIEAFINYIHKIDPEIDKSIYLSHSDFTQDNMIFSFDYEKRPIIILDDMFVEHHNIAQLHPNTDISALFNFIKHIYENRSLVISTCNFSFTTQIVPLITPLDRTGRYISRLQELMAGSSEIQLKGPDFRRIIAASQDSDSQSIF